MQKYQNNVTDRNGEAVVGVQVTVTTTAGVLAAIYSDNAGTPKPNPLTTDVNGYIEFYAENGRYNISIANAGGYEDVQIADAVLLDQQAAKKDELASAAGGEQVKFALDNAALRMLRDKLAEIVSIKDFGAIGDGNSHPLSERFDTLADAQAIYPFATSLGDEIDWAAWTKAKNYLVSLGVPGVIRHPVGRYVTNRPLLVNDSLDCATPIDGIGMVGVRGHRPYDTAAMIPVVWQAKGAFTSLLDYRACRFAFIRGIAFKCEAPNSVDNIIRFGAEGCANPTSMIRLGTIDFCSTYGGKVGINVYLTSNLFLLNSNISRATEQGLRLNSCGDWSLKDNLFNVIGPILTGGMGATTFDGAGVLAFGGGGSNSWSGGKVEVCTRGAVLDNVQGFQLYGITFDKCKEVGLTISGNQNTSGKTANLGYQPRDMMVSNCRFLANGWDGAAAHILFANTGTDLEEAVSLTGNTFSYAGPNAIPLDMSCPGGAVFRATCSGTTLTVDSVLAGTIAVGQRLAGPNIPVGTTVTALGTGTGGTGTYTLNNSISIGSDVTVTANAATSAQIYGVGPVRCIRSNNSGLGSSNIYISSAGNKYSGGALSYAMDSFSPNVIFDSGGGDQFQTPISSTWQFPIINNGSGSETRGTKRTVTYTFSWTPGSVPANDSVVSSVQAMQGAGFGVDLRAAAPASLGALQLSAYVPSANGGALRLFNNTGSAITGPSGTYTIRYDVDKWS